MKRILISILVLGSCLTGFSQSDALRSKMDPIGYAQIMKYERALDSRAKGNASDKTDVPEEISVLLTVNSGYDLAELKNIPGVKIANPGMKVLLVTMPLSEINKVAECKATKRISYGGKAYPMLNMARPASKVTELHNGLSYNLPQNYTGKGVMLGMMDTGLDPNHINFMNSSLTANRIKTIWYMPSNNTSNFKTYSTPSEIAAFTTDNVDDTHATHTTGIMGGSYNGMGTIAIGRQNAPTESGNIPYYGVATEAEMALGCGALYHSNIAESLYNFWDYCQKAGKPGAFNLSLGNNGGPRDGTSSICQYLSQFTDDVIVVIASGNEGYMPICIQKTISNSSDELKTLITNGGGSSFSGAIDLWSADSQSFDLTFGLFNTSNNQLIYTCPIKSTDEGSAICSPSYSSQFKGYQIYTSTTFSRYFTADSYVAVYNDINTDNNRFNSYIDIDLTLMTGVGTIYPALILSGNQGVSLDGGSVNTSLYFTNKGRAGIAMSGWTAGNADQSINELACADGVIAVGSYITKVQWPIVAGYGFGYGEGTEVGTVSNYTSYGTKTNGTTLPNFCAPGQGITSSYSTFYVDNLVKEGEDFYDDGDIVISYPDGSNAYVDRSTLTNGAKDLRTDYWYTTQGTSMACPYVTGVAALLLEQDPTLTTPEIRSILESTADFPADQSLTSAQTKQWGAGSINALKAMQKLIGDPGAIGDITVDTNDKLWIDMTDSELTASLAGERGVTAHLYSMAGYDVVQGSGSGESVTLNISRLPKGVYILTLQSSDGAKISRRVLIGQ